LSGSSRLPRNPSDFAAAIAERMGEQSVKGYLARIGRKGGLKGGVARARKLSPEKRSEIARKAAKARWARMRREA